MIKGLAEVMLIHNADAGVSANCVGALWNICVNGGCIVNDLAHV